ncbi:hypothetical protein B0H13DRAFT_2513461 [Mycena leptocephala]|nr:hypothetical protein B0H13DRAFT_2513461 [Mycena leptocephala]
MNAPCLSDIPLELLSIILGFTDAKTLLVCSAVCTSWQEIVKSTTELQYTIELWAEGMVRGDSTLFTCTEALKALRDRRRAWRNLEWTSKTVVQIEALNSCAYALVGSIFAQKPPGPNFLSISLSRLVDEPENARSIRSIGLDLQDFQGFRIDPSQDLIAFLFLPPVGLAYLELLTMSSQQPHPLAVHPHLIFATRGNTRLWNSFEIVDDIIGLFFWGPCYLVLLNWWTGSTIADVSCSISMQDFRFLSSRSYFVVHGNLQVPEGETLESGQLEIFTFGGKGTNYPTHVATLKLPELNPSGDIESMQILAGPSCANAMSGTPFSKSNTHRIFMVAMVLMSSTDFPHYWCRLFVHHRSLHRYVLDYMQEKKTVATIVPWDQWGPQKSRMLVEWYTWNGHHHVHGERVALPLPNRDSVQILDFNIFPGCDGAVVDPSSTESATELHFGPSALRLDGIFKDTVVTSLPYKNTLRSLDEEYDVFLIDQDRMLGIDNSEPRQMTVYTF